MLGEVEEVLTIPALGPSGEPREDGLAFGNNVAQGLTTPLGRPQPVHTPQFPFSGKKVWD